MAAYRADAALQWGWLGASTLAQQQCAASAAYDARWLSGLQSHLSPPCLACACQQSCCRCPATYADWEAWRSPPVCIPSVPVPATPWWCGGLRPAEGAAGGGARRRAGPAGAKSFGCPVCWKEFPSNARLRQHERTHSGEQPFGCTECHKSFLRKGDLNAHMRTHTDERPFGCTVCPKRFRSSANQRCHLRTHTGERPYRCRECAMRFAESGHLKRHLLTHTGEKPFACPVCPRRFGQKSNLGAHLLLHTGEKPYACTECPRRFKKSISLRAHLLTHPVASRGQPSASNTTAASAGGTTAQSGSDGVPLPRTSAFVSPLGIKAPSSAWPANYFERGASTESSGSPPPLGYLRKGDTSAGFGQTA